MGSQLLCIWRTKKELLMSPKHKLLLKSVSFMRVPYIAKFLLNGMSRTPGVSRSISSKTIPISKFSPIFIVVALVMKT